MDILLPPKFGGDHGAAVRRRFNHYRPNRLVSSGLGSG
jgi:hypothetical protein